MLKILLVIISFFVSSFAFADDQAKKDESVSYEKETDDGIFCKFSVSRENGLLVMGSGVVTVQEKSDIEYEPTGHLVAITTGATLAHGGEVLSDIDVWHQNGFVFTQEMIETIGDAFIGSCLAEIVFLPKDMLTKVGYKLPTTVVKK